MRQEEKQAQVRFSSDAFWRNAIAILLSIGVVSVVILSLAARYTGALTFDVSDLSTVISAVSAALAFIWLANGYFQQGQELKNTVHALIDQAEQQERSANALNGQLEALQQQLSLAREQAAALARPIFDVASVRNEASLLTGPVLVDFHIQVRNISGPALNVVVSPLVTTSSDANHRLDPVDRLILWGEDSISLHVANALVKREIVAVDLTIEFDTEHETGLIQRFSMDYRQGGMRWCRHTPVQQGPGYDH